MTSFHIPNLWNTERTRKTLVHWKMDLTDSNASRIIRDHILRHTQNTMEVATTYLLSRRLGEQTWEPLSNIIASDPYTYAVYAKEHNLLNTPGWKLLKRHSRTARRLIRTIKKSKYRQGRASRKYKHAWEVPRDYAHALQFNIHNSNNK